MFGRVHYHSNDWGHILVLFDELFWADLVVFRFRFKGDGHES